MKLTDDLVINIISRVPEKDLTRFTCVSKSWCSFINTDDSYLSQLRSHHTALLHRPFLIIEKGESVSGRWLYTNYLLELDSIEDGNPKPRQLHNPFDDSPCRDARVIASREGLLVLERRYNHKMVVSNPTTGKHHVVPPNPAGDDNVLFIGFGYDRVHGCYKLVTKIKHELSEGHVAELIIYNVNDCTWKKSRFDDFDDVYYDCELGECVDGVVYWPVYYEDMEAKILCFFLAEEEFHKVDPPPNFVFDEAARNISATVFDRRLCLVLWVPERVEFWLMECDYKKRPHSSRWIKFFSISGRETMLPPHCSCFGLFPVCFSACKNKIMFNVDNRQLFRYDIEKNEFRRLKTPINEFSHQYLGFTRVINFVPSLFGIGIF